jgi:hypothetical protein
MQALIFFLLLALIAAIIAGCIYVVKKRGKDLELVARQLKMEFYPKGDDSIGPMLANLEFFMCGYQRVVTNLMRGQINHQGRPVSIAIFDYSYTICLRREAEFSFDDHGISIGSNSETETFCNTVLVFYDKSLDLPGFSLRPEHLWNKLGKLLGCDDLNFNNFPTFPKNYRLLSNQSNDLRDLFQPNLTKFYESHKICTEAIGPYLLIFPTYSGIKDSGNHVIHNQAFNASVYLHPNEVKSYLDLGLKLLSLLEKNTSLVTH